MKYKLLRFSLLSILAMLCGVVHAADEPEVSFDFTVNQWGLPQGSGNGATASKEFTNTVTSQKVTLYATTKYYYHTDGYLMLGKSGSTLTLPTFDFDVEKIEVVGTSSASADVIQNIFVGNNSVSTETKGAKNVTNVYEIASNNQAAGTVYTLKVTSNHNTQISKIYIYKKTVTPGDNSVATTVTIDATGITNTNVFKGTDAGKLTATVKAGDAAVSDATVTWSSSDDGVATIEDDGSVTLVAAGEATITASYAGVEGEYKSSSATYKLTVINKDPNGPGSEKNPYTVAQARAAIDENTGVTGVYATGIVSKIVTAYSATNGYISYNISADGTTTADQLQAYNGKSYEGANFTSGDDIQVGDVVVVYGNLKKYKTSTYEFDADNQLISLKRKQVSSVTVGGDQTGIVGGNMELPLAVVSDASGAPIEGATVTWSSSNEDVAKVDGTVLSLLAVGTATITATFAGDDIYKGSSDSFVMTVTKSVVIEDGVFDFDMGSDYGSGLEKSNVLEQESTWTAGNVTMTLAGRNCWNDYGNPTLGQIRLYKSGNNEAAGSMTLSVPEEKVITKIEFTGASLGNMGTEDGEYESGTWTGSANSVMFTATDRTDLYTITVTYGDAPAQPAGFRDIKVNLTDDTWSTKINSSGAASTVYITVDEEGAIGTTDNAEDAGATLTGYWHGTTYGWQNFTASVPVEGCVKITYGMNDYGGDVSITNSDNVEVAKLNNKDATGKWSVANPDQRVAVAYYRSNTATTLNFSQCPFVGYFAVEAIDEADLPEEVTKYTITFDKGKGDGVAPAAIEVEKGQSFTAPKNYTIFAENKTLTGWSRNETTVYEIGQEITPEGDMTLTAVFTGNDVELADRKAPVTITFPLDGYNDNPKYNFGSGAGFIVTQATVNDKVIDVKADVAAMNGSFYANGTGWHVVNAGAKVTVPSCKGATVAVKTYQNANALKFGGTVAETGVDPASFTATAEDATLTIEQTADGYWNNLTITLPVPEDEPVATHTWDFTKWSEETVANLKADAAASSTEGWSDIEKATATEPSELSKDNCFWYVGGEVEPTANGTAISELAGLEFDTSYGAARSLAIAVNYQLANEDLTKGFGPYNGPAYLWLGGKEKACFTIKNVKGNTTITIGVESHKITDPRGIQLFVGETELKDADGNAVTAPTTYAVQTWKVAGDEDKVYDVVVKNTNGCHLYYIDAEIAELPAETTVTFDTTDAGAVGEAPAAQTVSTGTPVTIPANYTLYKDGYTLTAWSDGNKKYAAGETVATKGEPVILTPVFTKNTFELESRQEAVTLNFTFRRDQGAPIVQWQNTNGHIWVTQAEVNGATIDVPMTIDTNSGKFNNSNNTDCAQANNGTVFTIPSCKGAEVTMECHNSFTISTTTIDGQNDYEGKGTTVIRQTIAGTSDVVLINIGDGSYYRYVKVVLPVAESQGGETFVNADMSVEWPMIDNGKVDLKTYAATPASAMSVVSFEYTPTDATVSTGTRSQNPDNGLSFVTFTGSNVKAHWFVKPVSGVTFTPTQIKLYVQRFGTNKKDGVVVTAKVGDNGTESKLGTYTARRGNWTTEQEISQFEWSEAPVTLVNEVVIDLTEAQQTAFASGEGFHLYATTGLDAARAGGFADCRVFGKVNGTAANVNKYTLAAAVAPEAAGSINVYPAAEEYEEGASIKLTATENFGYDFVNWTDADGEVVSTNPIYSFDIAKNETLTANFEAVETYELALTVDGTNDYMVTIDPAPTMDDGKMMYEAGTAVQLTANSYDGLVTFNNWSDGETGSSKLISMKEDVTLTVVYEQADILAGWDFYKAGNNGRVADFASADNTTAALSLVNTADGTTSGWLDKSTLGGGGYESFTGAAVNWRTGASNGDVGNYHWQTKVNAGQFTDINVQFQMLYNYNAYPTYNAEYSLDGENWTKFGSITMTGAKSPESFNEQLPAEANNQKELYIRMLADKTSKVDGAASANDGNTLAMFFITGTEKLVDDGKAPVLMSTVPADKATGASASGKVVLTFDEKVKVAEGTTATLGSLTLTPVVSGKSISFEYKGLEYSTEYNFSLPANSVSDLTDNKLESAIALTFTTMTRPEVTKGLYDAVVGNVDELVAAISKAEARSDKNVRYRIFLKNGTYQLPQGTADVTHNVELKDGSQKSIVTKDVITYIKSGNISLIGESRDGVIITNTIPANETFEGKYGTASVYEGIGSSDVLQVSGSGLYFQDLTVSTGMEDGRGRDIALNDKGTQNVFKNVCLHGYQDTWKSGKGLYYFEGGVIRGRTDFLCGGGDAFFNQVDIVMCEKGGYVVAPQGNNHYGYVFKDCTLKGEASDVSGNYNLGRAWTGEAETYFINTTMEALPNAKAWSEWNNGPARFAEFNSKTANGTDVDLSQRATTINGTANNPVLTAEEALEIGNMHNSFGDWDPTLLTEQAPVPQNVKQEGNSLVWDNSNYALLWAIVKDGAVVDFTTEPTYELTESGTYAVRAANEMGGLSEASASVEATVAEVVKVTLNKGYSTLASDKALDFSKVEGLTAYIVTDAKNSKATLTSVDAAPAETGLVLKTDESGDYEIPVIASATAVEGNLLVAAVNGATVDALSVYVLDDGKFKVFAGTEIPAGKAYLPKSKIGAARLLELVFDDATGIATVDVDVPVDVYDLQGRRVKPTKKGIYVVDGKKVIIK